MGELGVDELVYLSTNIMQEYTYSDQPQIPDDSVLVYNYHEKDDALFISDGSAIDEDIVVPPPSWVYCSVFETFCPNTIRGNWLILCSNTRMTFVNEVAAQSLIDFLAAVHALTPDYQRVLEIEDALQDLEHMSMDGEK
jgi:hypothetical protein